VETFNGADYSVSTGRDQIAPAAAAALLMFHESGACPFRNRH